MCRYRNRKPEYRQTPSPWSRMCHESQCNLRFPNSYADALERNPLPRLTVAQDLSPTGCRGTRTGSTDTLVMGQNVQLSRTENRSTDTRAMGHNLIRIPRKHLVKNLLSHNALSHAPQSHEMDCDIWRATECFGPCILHTKNCMEPKKTEQNALPHNALSHAPQSHGMDCDTWRVTGTLAATLFRTGTSCR